ncbi:MAG TPA: nucleotidyltransferase family protein [Candidatus Hydrogenedentes bacterium]|nr:nucleotidyltransferase family protein [Candidatus Hydrogenedentota bacterium]HNT36373.1 nucleotidyltransferase family protein [bacterium]
MGVDELLREKRSEILRIAALHGGENVRVFGSVVRGQAGPDSDIDILVRLEEGRTLIDHVALIQDLEELLGRKVDVITEGGLRGRFRDLVLSEAVPL